IDTPERVDRLVISGSWARADDRFRLLFETRLAVLQNAGPAAYTALGQLLAYPPDWINAHEAAVHHAIARAEADLTPSAATEARLAMLLAHDRLDDLHRIRAPTLVLGAEDDMIVPISHARAIAERIPGATFAALSGGHFFPRTAPQQFA